jgi:dihydrofolate reductase
MIKLIGAFAQKNRVIGNKGKIPWHIKEDLLQYKEKTQGQIVLMGDNTYYSLRNVYYKTRPMPYAKIYIATIDKNLKITDELNQTEMVYDLIDFLKNYSCEDLWVCGGASIYRLSMPYVDEVYASEIKGDFEGDAFFPEFEKDFVLKETIPYEQFDLKIYKRG